MSHFQELHFIVSLGKHFVTSIMRKLIMLIICNIDTKQALDNMTPLCKLAGTWAKVKKYYVCFGFTLKAYLEIANNIALWIFFIIFFSGRKTHFHA